MHPPILIVLIGLPAAGKSSFATELKIKLRKLDYNCDLLDVDKIRSAIYQGPFNPDQEQTVIHEKFVLIHEMLQTNNILIIDDLHYYASMRHDLYQIVHKKKGIYLAIYIETSIEICKNWNQKREEPLSDEIINQIAEKFDIPGSKYSWDIPFYHFNPTITPISIAIEDFSNHFIHFLEKIYHKVESDEKKIQSTNKIESFTHRIDLQTRKIIQNFFKNTEKSSQIQEILEFIQQKLQISAKDKEFSRYLTQLRRRFIIWVMEHLCKEKKIYITNEKLISLFYKFIKSNL